eukprot:PhF_6_TR17591/c0_g1_i1/m.26740
MYAVTLRGYVLTHSKEAAEGILLELQRITDSGLPQPYESNHLLPTLVPLDLEPTPPIPTHDEPIESPEQVTAQVYDVLIPEFGAKFLPATPVLRSKQVTEFLSHRVAVVFVLFLLTCTQVLHIVNYFIEGEAMVNSFCTVSIVCGVVVFTLPLSFMTRARFGLIIRTFDFWYLSGVFGCIMYCVGYMQVCSGVDPYLSVFLHTIFWMSAIFLLFGTDSVLHLPRIQRVTFFAQCFLFMAVIVCSVRGIPWVFKSSVQECLDRQIPFGFTTTTLGGILGSSAVTFLGFLGRFLLKLVFLNHEFVMLSVAVRSH